MKPIFIIEHLEPKLWPWCIIEYKSISKLVGKDNLWFTNINKRDKQKLSNYGKVYTESIKNIDINLDKTCILDPDAPKTLEPKDAKSFHYFIFGGILGDDPPRKRTAPELTHFLPKAHKRNIGKEQFSTDNAVYVTSEIIKGKSLKEIEFQDTIEIPINNVESVILPYRYPLIKKSLSPRGTFGCSGMQRPKGRGLNRIPDIKSKPRISQELITYLKNKKGF